MNEREFCYWLRGFFEILEKGDKRPEKLVLTAEQVQMIDEHLKSVFAEKRVEPYSVQTLKIDPLMEKALEEMRRQGGGYTISPPTVTC